MVVKRRHSEDPPALAESSLCVFKVTNLEHHREGLCHEDTPHHKEHDLLTHHNGHGPKRTPQSQGPDIAHEDRRWVSVKPEKGQPRPHKRRAEDCQLTCARYEGKQQIF